MKYIFLILISLFASLTCLAQPKSGLRTPDKKNTEVFIKATDLMGQRKNKEAVQLLEKVTKQDDQFIEAFILLGELYDLEKEYQSGINAYKAAIEIDPDFYAESYFSVAKMQFLLADYDNAYTTIKQYLAINNRKPNLNSNAQKILRDASYARVAILQPVDFKPINLGEGINTEMGEYYPTLTADNTQLYFTRRIPMQGGKNRLQEDFFLARSNGKMWFPSRPVDGPINTAEYNEGAPSVSSDGRTMVYTVCELFGDRDYGNNRLGFGSCDLFVSFNVGGSWSKPENLGAGINTSDWESQPSLSADGKTLYFVRANKGRGKNASMDIYKSTLNQNSKWNAAQKLPEPINTPYNESSVFIHPDGQSLYFASEGHPGFGGEDIFVSRLGENGAWSVPVNLGYPINTVNDENSLLVAANGELAYFASDRAGGFGDLDLYQFDLPQAVKPIPVSYTKGKVIDAKTKAPLEASFQLIDLMSKDLVVNSNSDAVNGEFLVTLPANKEYALNVSKEGYLFHSENFALKEGASLENPKALIIELEKVEVGKRVVLNNIFFETAKFDLLKESEVELEKLNEFLVSNPDLRIEIGGHTDNVGEDAYNQTLSENRAKAVYTYLVAKGIAPTRLFYKGYGKSLPIESNDTSPGRAKNRRTEFKVL